MSSSTVCSPDSTLPESCSTLLQRVILPRRADPSAVRALYVDEQPAIARRVLPAAGGASPHPRDVDVEVVLAHSSLRRVQALSRYR
jgi:galactofuranosylgalactofuranosylrhamnosyl-N-acetylglucosaminyl-diphospho-decaprenol beta-1,5/1,6-galactofuranosyltransferase